MVEEEAEEVEEDVAVEEVAHVDPKTISDQTVMIINSLQTLVPTILNLMNRQSTPY